MWTVIRPTGPAPIIAVGSFEGSVTFWRRVRNGFRDSRVLTDGEGEDADRKGTRLQVDSDSESWDHTTYTVVVDASGRVQCKFV